uniref:Protein ALWAYS EARLY 3 n=1 Tax=Anthurium amnicola TaxID=1678845 RepID=A0A1D1ZCD6_9ARAE
MASTRKSRMINKRFSKLSEEPPDKDGSNTDKTWTKKRKLSDMLGSQWSKEELERFYVAYRKYGKDWKKVSGNIRNRSIDMVEALYNMNRAYLSLPEGTATAAGLIAMMTDHYNILEGTDSDNDSNDAIQTIQKPQKRVREKLRPNTSKGSEASYPDLLQYHSSTASYGCLSLLKKKRSGGSRPRAVGKRTPRFPVSYTYDREERHMFVSPYKRVKSGGDADDDEGVHVAALALAEASQRGGSPQVSRTPSRTERAKSSPVQSVERKYVGSEAANSKFTAVRNDDGGPEGSLGSIEAKTGDFVLDNGYHHDSENANTVGTQRRVKKSKGKKPKAVGIESTLLDDDVREACSGTEEGLSVRGTKAEIGTEISDRKTLRSYQGPRKRNRQLFSGDENTALDALQTLANLSLNILLPGSVVESESSVQAKEDKKNTDVEKPIVLETTSTKSKKDKRNVLNKKAGTIGTRKSSKHQKVSSPDPNIPPELKQQDHQPVSKIRKKKQKPVTTKVPKNEFLEDTCRTESPKKETMVEESKKSTGKAKGANQVSNQKQAKLVKTLEQASAGPDMSVSMTNEAESTRIATAKRATLPSKPRNRRKMGLQKALAQRELKPTVLAGDDHSDKYAHSTSCSAADLKEKLSHCLSSPLPRRWCIFEWFYSAIDYPWFAKSEFIEYLNHVGLGHVPRLTRVEWGVIRSSLGKPRRLSKHFLQVEREKLEQYRESVRTHYTELRAGIKEGLPADLARPLSVGQRVIACHPKTREIHNGNILTVDRNRCRVQFDRPELGVEFVMDTDCMPLNPSENMSDALRRGNIVVDKISEALYETRPYSQPQDWRLGDSIKFSSNEIVENADGSCNVASSSYPMNTLMKQAKGDTIDAIVEAKAAANEVAVAAQQAMYNQPCTLAQIQAREADIRALADLTRVLHKKEALLIELRNMNEEVSTKQKEGDSIKEFEHFRKQYAMVLLQLRDANDQVVSALLYLRQRNTYHGNATPSWLKSMDNSGATAGAQSSLGHCAFPDQESGTHVLDIVEGSRRKSRTMVDAAVKTCTERHDPPAEVAQILDSAVSSLHPCCPQNIPIYREIELCMGIIKNQMLAKIPTPSTISTSDVTTL